MLPQSPPLSVPPPYYLENSLLNLDFLFHRAFLKNHFDSRFPGTVSVPNLLVDSDIINIEDTIKVILEC